MNSDAQQPRLVPVGKITRPHGVRGAVKVYPYGETLASLGVGAEVHLDSSPGGPGGGLAIAGIRPQGKMWIVEFAGVSDRDKAEDLCGQEILVPESVLPPTDEGEYYYFQLIGLRVETTSGETLGPIKGILEAGGNDVYVVERQDGREVLIPAVDEIVRRVDLENGVMVVDLPRGLTDDL